MNGSNDVLKPYCTSVADFNCRLSSPKLNWFIPNPPSISHSLLLSSIFIDDRAEYSSLKLYRSVKLCLFDYKTIFVSATDAAHPSPGLWILGGFLIFVIVEKLFAFEQEAESEDTSANNANLTDKISDETEKKIENNNCINLIESNSKNGFSKQFTNDFSKIINEVISLIL